MSRRPPVLPLLAALLLVLAGVSCGTAGTSSSRFALNVAWLSDDARAGRGTGSEGYDAAGRYVAAAFTAAGARPAGDDGGWRQEFSALGSRELFDGNRLRLLGSDYALADEWMPFQTAASCDVTGTLVFAGYGITDEESGYDDYAGLDVDGRIVVVLRRSPRAWEADGGGEAEGPFHTPAWVNHRLFVTKINTAYKHGAAALIVINDPRSYPPGSEKDVTMPYASIGMTGVGASLPAVHMTAAAGARLFTNLGYELAGLQAGIDDNGAPDSLEFRDAEARLVIATGRREVPTFNVVGLVPGDGSTREYVVVGAHLDHLGLGDRSSRGGAEAQGRIHNGADDNASGTSGLIEVAHALQARRGELKRDVYLIAFGAEEWGLLGSAHWAAAPARPLVDCAAMINMDMIGRSVEGYVAVEGVGSAEGFTELVVAAHDARVAAGAPALDLNLADKASANSDHASFYDRGVPVLSLFTGLHDEYHMPEDDAGLVNAEGGAAIAGLAAELAARLSAAAVRPVFVPPAAPSDPGGHGTPEGETDIQAYRVSFGSRPDMTYQAEDGVRLSGTREGSPAHRAGLQRGDVIVALDGKPIRNLNDYAVLLFSRKPGDTIEVTLRRAGREVKVTAVLEGAGGS